jgi:hypothetical protein
MGIRSLSLVVACLCCSAIAAGQTSVPAKTYDVADAYEIYSLLLPHEESYRFAKETLMIGEETVSNVEIVQGCLTPAAANKFKDAIADFNLAHREKRLLSRRFQIEKSYKLVSSDRIKALPDHPQSFVAYVVVSPVGFNHAKTRAIVYVRSSCGGLCGSASFHLLEKVHGSWKEVPGDICRVAS